MLRLNIENHELTKLENEVFAFGCFSQLSQETLSHWHTHNEIVYVHTSSHEDSTKLQQSCTIFINGCPFDCLAGEFIFIPHESLHAILPNNDALYTALVLGDTLLTQLMQDFHIKQALIPFFSNQDLLPLHVTQNHPSHHILEKHILSIIEIYDSHPSYFEVSIKMDICHFFIGLLHDFPDAIHSQPQANSTARNIKLLKTSLDYIAQNYLYKISIDQLSQLTNLSNQHYCRLFKAYTGKTVVDYLTDIRLTHATILITSTDLPITHIPELTGFCNPNYFSRVFKQKYHCSPSHYRKLCM